MFLTPDGAIEWPVRWSHPAQRLGFMFTREVGRSPCVQYGGEHIYYEWKFAGE